MEMEALSQLTRSVDAKMCPNDLPTTLKQVVTFFVGARGKRRSKEIGRKTGNLFRDAGGISQFEKFLPSFLNCSSKSMIFM